MSVSPLTRFAEGISTLKEAAGGSSQLDAELKKVGSGQLDISQLGAKASLSPVEAGMIELQAAAAELSKEYGYRSLTDWYQVATGRLEAASTAAVHGPAEVAAALAQAQPVMEAIRAEIGELAGLGHGVPMGMSREQHGQAVGGHHQRYLSGVRELQALLGPFDTARRAGQLEVDDAANVFRLVVSLNVNRNHVRQMGMIY